MRFLKLFSASLFLFSATANAAVLGDFDGDGKSDVSKVRVDRSGNDKGTYWTARLTGNGTNRDYFFSKPGDALVQGNFYGDGKTYPGIVYVSDAKKPLNWYVKNQDGSERSFTFGNPGDSIPNQGDVDCDGKAEIITITNNSSGARVWHFLSSSNGNTFDVTFATKNDRVGVADMNGDGCAELVSVEISNSTFVWKSRSIFSTTTTSFAWGTTGDIPLLPADLTGDRKADYLISRPGSTHQILYMHNGIGFSEKITAGRASGIPMVGRFIGPNFFAWVEREIGNFSILNANRTTSNYNFGDTGSAIVRPDGTVIQPNDSGKFGSSSSGGGGDSGGGNLAGCDETRRISSSRSGSYKLKFWNAHNSKGKGKINNDSGLTGNISDVKVYDLNSNSLASDADFGGYEYGNRERWYTDEGLSGLPREVKVAVTNRSGRVICYEVGDVRKDWFAPSR